MWRIRWRERQAIKAVHERDLEKVLEDLGLLEHVKSGKAKCDICGDPLNLDNLLCIFPTEGRIGLCCDQPECYQRVLLLSKGE
jgi:hypothetical protein